MASKVTNNAFGTLASGITDSSTELSLSSGQGGRFPVLGAGDFFWATLVDSSNNLEIIKVTARSADNLTVERGQDGTLARAYSLGDRIELRPVAALLNGKMDTSDAIATFLDKDDVAADASKLGGVVPGNYLRKDVAGNWELASGTVGTGFAEATLELRETNFVGAAQNSLSYAPRQAYHWSGRAAAQIVMDATGKLNVMNGAGNADSDFGAANITASGTMTSAVGVVVGGNATNKITMSTSNIIRGYLGADATNSLLIRNASGTTVGSVDQSGNALFIANVTAYSDERLKTNWRFVDSDFVERLAGIKAGTYWRLDLGIEQVGISAQDLQKVLPVAVPVTEDGTLHVAYGQAAMVSAVALADEVVDLKNTVKSLLRRVEELEGK